MAKDEIGEAINAVAFYGGWPMAIRGHKSGHGSERLRCSDLTNPTKRSKLSGDMRHCDVEGRYPVMTWWDPG